jgi:predicted secreted protein
MIPNAAAMVSARPVRAWLSAAALLGLLVQPSLAGDRAEIDMIGFSGDARYFAFEEFGIRDGSGFAYSTLYVVDLQADEWVSGTPVRISAENEEVPLREIRSQATSEAAPTLNKLAITEPATIAALIGDGEPDMGGKHLRFGAPSPERGEVQAPHELALTQFDARSPSTCAEWFGAEPLGFALQLSGETGERELHRDSDLPRSRGCPLDYRLYGVVLPFGAGDIGHGVAIVSVYPGGFEGPDRRFIAVPLAP